MDMFEYHVWCNAISASMKAISASMKAISSDERTRKDAAKRTEEDAQEITALMPAMKQTETHLSSSVNATIDGNGVMTLIDMHPLKDPGARFALDATEAWNLLEWLLSQRDLLYQVTHQETQNKEQV